jgi:hypothetical protein
VGWVILAAMIVAYGVANLLQSVAAANTALHMDFSLRLLWRLGQHKTYLLGIGFQLLAFTLAVLSRRDLPLFLVQSAVAAGLGVTAVLGVVALKWRLPPAEIALLLAMGLGVAGLIVSAKPRPSRPVGMSAVVLLAVAFLAISAVAVFAVRLHGARGSVVLGSLAGLAFGAAAVASRPLANVDSFTRFFGDPLLYLLVAHSLVGQLLLGLAMQRGSTTAAVASMDAASAVPAAAIGLLFLGDGVVPGLGWLAGAGFVVTLLAVIGLSFYAEPQHHHVVRADHKHPSLVGTTAKAP